MKHGLVAALMWAGLLVAAPPAPAPAQEGEALGTIAGTVLDKGSGDPVLEAIVEVVGQQKKTRTDLDGKFTFKLPPGTYELRVAAPYYQGTRLQNVTVKANEVTRASASLALAAGPAVQVVEVVAQAKKAAEQTQLLKRQKAATMQENVGGETIAKSPDSDAADVVKRVPSVTITDDDFLIVRGLFDRYSYTRLNQSRLTSTDPLKRSAKLTLFPADFIESLSVTKTFLPDLPGDFSGGIVDIDLREFPDQPEAKVALSTAYNTASSFQRFLTADGCVDNYYPHCPGLPGVFPNESIQSPDPAQQRFFASTLPNIWNVESDIAPPNAGGDVLLGNTWGPLGLQFAGTYDSVYENRAREVVTDFTNAGTEDDPKIVPNDAFVYQDSRFKTRLGGILTAGLKPADNHKFSFRTLVNRTGLGQALFGQGTDKQGQAGQPSQIQFVQEQLAWGQLEGNHRLPWLEVDWRTAASDATRRIPDSRTLYYAGASLDQLAYTNSKNGGLRAFETAREWLTDSGLDLTIPFPTRLPFTEVWSGLPAKFKFGPAYSFSKRTFDLRLFEYRLTNTTLARLPPEVLLNPDNVGSLVQFSETTQPRDVFQGTQEILAGYGMLDLPIVRDRLRIIGGVREEYSLIRVQTADVQGNPLFVRKRNLNYLPGASLVFTPRADMNLRAAYSKTVSRPQLRELSDAIFPEPAGFDDFVGNPDLVQATVRSIDPLRWEWFFAERELVSFGVFLKSFTLPIEPIVIPFASENVLSLKNAESAKVKGLELEVRKGLGFVSRYLADFQLWTNLSYEDSSTIVPKAAKGEVQTNSQRQLAWLSPYVLNVVLDYSPRWGTAQLLYNRAGRRIVAVGANGLPDIVEQPRGALDAVLTLPLKDTLQMPLKLKFAVTNILNAPWRTLQGDFVKLKFTRGTTFGVGVTYEY